jgi:hypothetical protein
MQAKGGRQDENLKMPCPGGSPSKMRSISWTLAGHGGADFDLVGRQAIDQGIAMGRSAVWLRLTREQYAKARMIM